MEEEREEIKKTETKTTTKRAEVVRLGRAWRAGKSRLALDFQVRVTAM